MGAFAAVKKPRLITLPPLKKAPARPKAKAKAAVKVATRKAPARPKAKAKAAVKVATRKAPARPKAKAKAAVKVATRKAPARPKAKASLVSYSPRAPRRKVKVAALASLGAGLLLAVLLVRSAKAKVESAPAVKPDPNPIEPPMIKPDPKEEPAGDGPVMVSSRAPNGAQIVTVSSFPGYKRATGKVPLAAVAAANEAIAHSTAGIKAGASPADFLGEVYARGAGWAVVYEQHYWDAKGVHLGATVYVEK
jgi:hypothetical protein